MSSYSRRDVLRIVQISPRQLQGWERAGLISAKQEYSFQDLRQLKTLRSLREEDVPAASIRDSVVAMKAVAGMTNPLLEATVVRTGSRLAFRHCGAMVDPIRRQLLFDFDRVGQENVPREPALLRKPNAEVAARIQQDLFLVAVQAEELGEKDRAIELYTQIIESDPSYAAAYINLGTIYFHLRQFVRAEELYRAATVADASYVLAFFDLGNVLDELGKLDESIAAYRRAIQLAPGYADAHYNLALAYEAKDEPRLSLRHWQAYVRLDRSGPWADHARSQIHRLLGEEVLSIAWRSDKFVPRNKRKIKLQLVDAE